MKYNPKPFERRLNRYVALLYSKIEKMIDKLAHDVATRTLLFKPSPDNDFFFRNYPALSKMVDGLLTKVVRDITKSVKAGIEWSWDLSNVKNDEMVAAIVKTIGAERIPTEALLRWNQKNLPALQAFENRRIAGMNLSERVWNFMSGVKGDLELALDLGIGEGASADRLSREVRGYLREPARLYRRVRDEKGILRLSKSASNYHPGQGVYRSSYKNAKRLTVTETNMAYRNADNERINEIDWILGYEVHLSNNHTCLNSKGVPEPFFDICDILQGRYPKWFKFTGWHPNCRCYTTTILPSQDEFISYLAAMDEEGNSSYQLSGFVNDMPPQFNDWVRANADRIAKAQERGTLPYFLKDNPDAWNLSKASQSKFTESSFDDVAEEWKVRCEKKDFYETGASKFDFLGFKKEVEDILGKPVTGRIYAERYEDEWYFTMTAEGFELRRNFYHDRKDGYALVCHHELFTLDEKMQGSGISKKIFNALYEQYQNVGVQKLEVFANIDVGGYTWARYGFCTPEKGQALRAIRYNRSKYPELVREAEDLVDNYYDSHHFSSDKPFPMNLLTPKYKKLLLGSDWEGVLDFRDKEQLAIWESYLKS